MSWYRLGRARNSSLASNRRPLVQRRCGYPFWRSASKTQPRWSLPLSGGAVVTDHSPEPAEAAAIVEIAGEAVFAPVPGVFTDGGAALDGVGATGDAVATTFRAGRG
jgi:hypothetical protein